MRRYGLAFGVAALLACEQAPAPVVDVPPAKAEAAPAAQEPSPPAESPNETKNLGPANSLRRFTVGVEYQITATAIMDGERVLLELPEGVFPSSSGALSEALAKLDEGLAASMKRSGELAKGLGAPGPESAILHTRWDTKWDTFMTLVEAVERAGVSEFHLDLASPDDSARLVSFDLPSVMRGGQAPKTPEPAGPLLAIEFLGGQTRYAWVPGGEKAEMTTAPVEALVETLAKLQAEHPKREALLVSAQGSIGVKDVMTILEELIGRECLEGKNVGCPVDELYFVGSNATGYDPEAQGPLAALTHSTGAWGRPLLDPDIGDDFGVGGLGLSGKGDSGARYGIQSAGVGGIMGRGTGFSQSARRSDGKKSKIRLGKPTVQGKLDPKIVRRVVRQHHNEVRYCYDKEQVKNRELEGQVAMRFVIGTDGLVKASQVESATLKNAKVHACLVAANRRWAFPKPEGGVVVVKMSYTFSPPAPK